MPTWMWLNICFGALFILAVVGVPLWMVISRPDTGPRLALASPRHGPSTSPSRRPAPHAPGRAAGARPGNPARASSAGVS